MDRHHLRLMLFLAPLIFLGSASVVCAQRDFKGARPPNPEVRRASRASTDRSAKVNQLGARISQQIEEALERGNKLVDQVDNLIGDAPPEAIREAYRPAEQEYRRVLALNPREERGFYGLGNALAGEDRYAEAEQAYRQALRLRPRYAEPYYGLGNLSLNQEHPEAETIGFYKKAISLKPDFDLAYVSIGDLLGLSGRESEAMTWYQNAIRHKPDSGLAYLSLGILYREQKRYSEAIEQLKQAIRFHNELGYTNLAYLYEEQKRYPEAVAVYQQWIRFKPSQPAYSSLGLLYKRMERYAEAVEAFRHAVLLEPDDESDRYELGLAYLKINNKGAAREQYSALKKLESGLADDLLKEINKQ